MLINLTPHAVHIIDDKGAVEEIGRSLYVARCYSNTPPKKVTDIIYRSKIVIPVVTATKFDGVELVGHSGGKVNLKFEDLLRDNTNSIFIVSGIVAEYMHKTMPQYGDAFVVPDTDPSSVVRDENGVIKGVKRVYTYFEPPG